MKSDNIDIQIPKWMNIQTLINWFEERYNLEKSNHEIISVIYDSNKDEVRIRYTRFLGSYETYAFDASGSNYKANAYINKEALFEMFANEIRDYKINNIIDG